VEVEVAVAVAVVWCVVAVVVGWNHTFSILRIVIVGAETRGFGVACVQRTSALVIHIFWPLMV
jgi:hypothetical protein